MSLMSYVFFFQAEDGIRDGTVTGVQTCALPISKGVDSTAPAMRFAAARMSSMVTGMGACYASGAKCGNSLSNPIGYSVCWVPLPDRSSSHGEPRSGRPSARIDSPVSADRDAERSAQSPAQIPGRRGVQALRSQADLAGDSGR